MNKCFIIGPPRSGTTIIFDVLVSHPLLESKYINEKILEYFVKNKKISLKEMKEKTTEVLEKFDVIKEVACINHPMTYSRNIIYKQKNLVIVRTFRKNKLKQAISALLAEQTGCWHKSNKDYLSILKKLKPIIPSEIQEKIKKLNVIDKLLDKELQKINHIKIEYEKFHTRDIDYKINYIKKIYQKIKLPIIINDRMINYFKNKKLNNLEFYKMIPNFQEIDEKFSNEKNGVLFEKE